MSHLCAQITINVQLLNSRLFLLVRREKIVSYWRQAKLLFVHESIPAYQYC